MLSSVTRLSLPYDAQLDLEDPRTHRAVFYGLGSDGTVGANKNTIKFRIPDQFKNRIGCLLLCRAVQRTLGLVNHDD